MSRFQSQVRVKTSTRFGGSGDGTIHYTNVLGPRLRASEIYQTPVNFNNSSPLSNYWRLYRHLYPCSGYAYIVSNGDYGGLVHHCRSLEEALGFLAYQVKFNGWTIEDRSPAGWS